MKKQLFGLQIAYVNKVMKQMKIEFISQNTQLAFKLVKIKEENDQLERDIQSCVNEKMDVTMPNHYEQEHFDNVDQNIDTETTAINEVAASLELAEKEQESIGNSFWSDIETWANSSYFDSKNEQALGSPNEWAIIDNEFSIFGNKDDGSHAQPIKNEGIQTNHLEQIESVDFYNDAILEQIDSIKTQYIVGKIAGEDLYDHQGHVIVARNSLLTREVVEQANENGKLAELIVNMKLNTEGVD